MKNSTKIEKEQVKANRLTASVTAKESKRKALEQRINQTKTLYKLKEQESKLKHQNENDQAIIKEENASPSNIEAEGGSVAERNKELACLEPQIE